MSESITEKLDRFFGPAPTIGQIVELEIRLLSTKLLCIRTMVCIFDESPELILEKYDAKRQQLIDVIHSRKEPK